MGSIMVTCIERVLWQTCQPVPGHMGLRRGGGGGMNHFKMHHFPRERNVGWVVIDKVG